MAKRKPMFDELTNRGLIARGCGARMYRLGLDWVCDLVDGGPALDPWMQPEEVDARVASLPGSWKHNWWLGWNEAAQADLAGKGS